MMIEATLSALEPLIEAKTGDEVAQVLRAAGVKGYRMDMCNCPIAKYLDKITGNTVHFVHSTQIDAGTTYVTQTSPAMQDFIERFDEGEFPDLQETSPQMY